MIDFFITLAQIYLVVGVVVAVYSKIVAKVNIPAMFLVTLFWPLFILTGVQSGALTGRSQKKLPW